MEEKAASAPMLRIPAMLMPSYNGVMATEDGKQAPKRVRVLCGVCEKLRYYSIHRGVTRIGGVIACEACRHFYQKFKRQPCILTCLEGGSCLVLNDNSRNRCRACWIGHILSRCPVPPELYQNFISHLPKEIQEKMPPEAQVAELIPESRKGSLGLEVSRNGGWDDVTVAAQPTTEDSGIEPYESLENNYDGDSSMEASLGHNPEHFSGNSETGDSEPSHTNEGEVVYVDGSAVQWWMQNETSNQTYFNMGNMNSSEGFTSLTAMQAVDGLQPLMPLTPVEYSPDQQQANGFHDLMSLNYSVLEGYRPLTNRLHNSNIKQEPENNSQDGESLEARLFESISVKQEFYPHHTQTDVQIPIYSSPYLDQIKSEKEAPLDIKFVTREHEVQYNGVNGWNVQEHKEESTLLENTSRLKKKKKPKAAQDNEDTKPVSEAGADTTPPPEKSRKRVDRFNGIPLEEVAKKVLPDHLRQNLDILIIGINPGLFAAHVGHYYAGPGNHFWKCMFLSGLIPEPYSAYDDHRMLEHGIGFTNVVERTTRSSTDLSKKEMKEGSEILKLKIQQYKPRIAVFNGKTIYEIYSGKKNFCFGKQSEKVEGTDTHIWVMPSSSARCAQLPRALDKVPFYAALRKFLDYISGRVQELDEAEVVFTDIKLSNVKKIIKLEPEELESNEEESNSSFNAFEKSASDSPVKGRQSPQKRKSEQTVKSKKK